ncbi:hypothetical protein [Natronoglycomyces albus]|uniref:Uncharacterized protein n=1 Tax=Natronoglycomyces albus TaxID=2811108 RepID=A0A895XSV0_9ACTN|nr:hypothetical protein [Natronoglycomyces albus]QSB05616.1 hypothetical protein JQS30_01415 [Natronoglycomyces albus]
MSDTQTPPSYSQFPCSSCGAQVEFQPGANALHCPYCGAAQDIELVTKEIERRSFVELQQKPRRARDQVPPRLYVCEQCAAHTESDTWSTECQFCGAALVADTFDPDLIAPEGVLPFQVDHSGARERLTKWINTRWFAPNALKKVKEAKNTKSTYLPHWVWDADTQTAYRGQRGIDYYVTVTRNGKSVRERRTRWTPVRGNVARNFRDFAVSASTHVNQKHLEEIGTDWPIKSGQAYQPEFLSGHQTQRYDIDPEQGLVNAKERMDRQIVRDIRRDIGGDKQRITSKNTRYSNIHYRLMLMPVWMVAYMFRGKSWQVLVNGVTGSVSGERPYSPWKIAFAVTIAVLLVVAFFILDNQYHIL